MGAIMYSSLTCKFNKLAFGCIIGNLLRILAWEKDGVVTILWKIGGSYMI